MRHTKKWIGGTLAAAVLTFSSGAMAAEIQPINSTIVPGYIKGTVVDPGSSNVEEQQAYYNSFSGTVTQIEAHHSIEGGQFIAVEGDDGSIANIIATPDTHFINGVVPQVGDTITGYYKANAPMIMIYPPQYSAAVVSVHSSDYIVHVDQYDENLISADGWLKLTPSEETVITTQDGTEYTGELGNQKLAVTYTVSTRSIPSQTTPLTIVVLNDDEEVDPGAVIEEEEAIEGTEGTEGTEGSEGSEGTEEGTEGTELPPIGDVSEMDIIVEGAAIEAPAAFLNDEGVVMVPLRAIAEALGYEITWDPETRSAQLGLGISLQIGKDYYVYMKTAPIELGTAPVIVQGSTFVPLQFFKQVAKVNNAYVFEGSIVIDNEEEMK